MATLGFGRAEIAAMIWPDLVKWFGEALFIERMRRE